MHPSCSSKAKFRLDDLHCVADGERLARTALAACPGYSYNRPRYLAVRVTCPAGTFVLTCLHLSPKYSGNSRSQCRIRMFLSLPDPHPDPIVRIGIRILPSSRKNSKKNLDFYCFLTSL